MKQICLSLILALVTMASFGQNVVYGDNVEKRSIGSFHAIESSSGIEVVMSKGDKEELAITVGNQEYLNEIKTEVEGGVLKIYRTSDWKFWKQWKNFRVKVYVSYKTIDGVRATSGSSIKADDISGGSFSARVNSGGSITLSGKVESLDVDGSSGGQFHGYSLSTNNCKAAVSSGAGIQITVNKEISAKANSGGYVRFRGEGLIRDINVNSGGSVKRQS